MIRFPKIILGLYLERIASTIRCLFPFRLMRLYVAAKEMKTATHSESGVTVAVIKSDYEGAVVCGACEVLKALGFSPRRQPPTGDETSPLRFGAQTCVHLNDVRSEQTSFLLETPLMVCALRRRCTFQSWPQFLGAVY